VQEPITGVSECIIMGRPIPLGTGLFKVLAETPQGLVNRDPVELEPRTTLMSHSTMADFSSYQPIPEATLAIKQTRELRYQ